MLREISEYESLFVPVKCPSCGCDLMWDGLDIVCPNPECLKTSRGQVINWINVVGKVDGLGGTMIEKFLKYFMIDSLTEFVDFAQNYLEPDIRKFCYDTEGLGDSAKRILCEMLDIHKAPIAADTFLKGLGLAGLGGGSVDKLLQAVQLNELLKRVVEEDFSVKGVNRNAIESLREASVLISDLMSKLHIITATQKKQVESSGITVCITGKLSVTRADFVKECSDKGITEVAVNKADVLVTDDPFSGSSKARTARDRGIKMMSEEQFRSEYLK